MKHTWNTGRLYTPNGQQITALLTEGRLLFKDHSRLICGEITEPYDGSDLQTFVMKHYDANRYAMSVEAINL